MNNTRDRSPVRFHDVIPAVDHTLIPFLDEVHLKDGHFQWKVLGRESSGNMQNLLYPAQNGLTFIATLNCELDVRKPRIDT